MAGCVLLSPALAVVTIIMVRDAPELQTHSQLSGCPRLRWTWWKF